MFPDSIKQLIRDFRTIHGPDDCTEQNFAAAASISSMRLQAAQSQLSIPFLGIQWDFLSQTQWLNLLSPPYWKW